MAIANPSLSANLVEFFARHGIKFVPRVIDCPGLSLMSGCLFSDDERQLGILESAGGFEKKHSVTLRIFGLDQLVSMKRIAEELTRVINFQVTLELASTNPRYCEGVDSKIEKQKSRWVWIGATLNFSCLALLILAFLSFVVPTLDFSSSSIASAFLARIFVYFLFGV